MRNTGNTMNIFENQEYSLHLWMEGGEKAFVAIS